MFEFEVVAQTRPNKILLGVKLTENCFDSENAVVITDPYWGLQSIHQTGLSCFDFDNGHINQVLAVNNNAAIESYVDYKSCDNLVDYLNSIEELGGADFTVVDIGFSCTGTWLCIDGCQLFKKMGTQSAQNGNKTDKKIQAQWSVFLERQLIE